ncbi:hypothetical protein BD779DRAFT_1519959 [Infundibulicybe gibba]|nr:hypothetical protein BD779DRAFT_1519959 [Infundibulicybe gibba]
MDLGFHSLPGRSRTSAQRSSPTSTESLDKTNDDPAYMSSQQLGSSRQFLAETRYSQPGYTAQTNHTTRTSPYTYHHPAHWADGSIRPLRQFSPPGDVCEPPISDTAPPGPTIYQIPIDTSVSSTQRLRSPVLDTSIPGPSREFQSYPIISSNSFPSEYHHPAGRSHDTHDGFYSTRGSGSSDLLSSQVLDPLYFISNTGPPSNKSDYNLSSVIRTDTLSSIPMCNNSGSSPSPTHPSLATPDLLSSDGRSRLVTDSNSVLNCDQSLQPSRDVIEEPLNNSKAVSFTQLVKKKKSKMHDCGICGKSFPRPSGLRTHMNTHNNLKPYPCGFPGCRRSFAVRSNAKRHLRTHGVLPLPTLDDPAPYVVGFSAPTVMPPPSAQVPSKAPFRLRWMPPSLIHRSNADSLKSVSDPEYSDDEGEPEEASTLSPPLHPVTPSIRADDGDDEYEERNSYAEAGSHPYHPSQV